MFNSVYHEWAQRKRKPLPRLWPHEFVVFFLKRKRTMRSTWADRSWLLYGRHSADLMTKMKSHFLWPLKHLSSEYNKVGKITALSHLFLMNSELTCQLIRDGFWVFYRNNNDLCSLDSPLLISLLYPSFPLFLTKKEIIEFVLGEVVTFGDC